MSELHRFVFITLIALALAATASRAQTLHISEFYRDPPGNDIVNVNQDSVEAGEFVEIHVASGGDIENWKLTDFDASAPLAVAAPLNIGARIKALRGGQDALVATGEIILIYLGGGGLHLVDRIQGSVYILYGGAGSSTGGLLSNSGTGAGDPLCLLSGSGTAVDFTYYGSMNVDVDADLNSDEEWAGWPHDSSNKKALSAISFASLAGNLSAHRITPDPASAGSSAWSTGPPSPGSVPLSLPVELLSFDVSRRQGFVVVNWVTASEYNNASFSVFRRMESDTSWSHIAEIPGAGSRTDPLEYQCQDLLPPDAWPRGLWYRMTQRDWNGEERECAERFLSPPMATINRRLRLHPNPASDYVTLSDLPSGARDYFIHGLDGRLRERGTVQVSSGSASTGRVNLRSLPAGLYEISVTGSTENRGAMLRIRR